MSTFKRNSSKFSRGSRSEGGEERRSSSRSESRGERRSSGGGKGKFAFQNLGSLTIPKTVDDGLRDMILDELRGSDIKFVIKVYPPKGVNEVTLNRDDLLLITFKVGEKDPDFVVGKLLLPNDNE